MNVYYHKNKNTTMAARDPLNNLERELKIRGFSPRTVKSYLLQNKSFLNFIKKSPKEISNDDIRQYLLFLKNKNCTNSTLNVALNALKFYYRQILKRKFFFDIKGAKKSQYLPVILSKEEIRRMLEKTKNPKHNLIRRIGEKIDNRPLVCF